MSIFYGIIIIVPVNTILMFVKTYLPQIKLYYALFHLKTFSIR